MRERWEALGGRLIMSRRTGMMGSAGAPFLTLARAQMAMRGSGAKTAYIRAGTYRLAAALMLTPADNGEAWRCYLLPGG